MKYIEHYDLYNESWSFIEKAKDLLSKKLEQLPSSKLDKIEKDLRRFSEQFNIPIEDMRDSGKIKKVLSSIYESGSYKNTLMNKISKYVFLFAIIASVCRIINIFTMDISATGKIIGVFSSLIPVIVSYVIFSRKDDVEKDSIY